MKKKIFCFFIFFLFIYFIGSPVFAKTTANGVTIEENSSQYDNTFSLYCEYDSGNYILIDRGCSNCSTNVEANDGVVLPFDSASDTILSSYDFMKKDGSLDCPLYIYGDGSPILYSVAGFANENNVNLYPTSNIIARLDVNASQCTGRCSGDQVSYEEGDKPVFTCNYVSTTSNKTIKTERTSVGGVSYITYPDSIREPIPSNYLSTLQESCADFYYNTSNKKIMIGNSDINRHLQSDNYYESSIYEFLCNSSDSIEYFCNNGTCNFPNNTSIDCNNWTHRIEDIPKSSTNFCKDVGIKKSLKFIGNLFIIAKIIVPILLIVMGTIDFSKSVFSSDADSLKKSSITFAYRILAGVAIFFLPTIISFVFDGILKNSLYKECNKCLFHPDSCVINE